MTKTQVENAPRRLTDALQEQKSGILGWVGDRVAESGLVLNMPEVWEYKKEEEMKGFDPCVLFNKQMGVLMKEKQGGYAIALHQLMSKLLSAHQNVLDCVKGLRDQRDKLIQEILAKTAGPVLQSLSQTF